MFVDEPRLEALRWLDERVMAGQTICSRESEPDLEALQLDEMAEELPGDEGLLRDGRSWVGSPEDAAAALGAVAAFTTDLRGPWFIVIEDDHAWLVGDPPDVPLAAHLYPAALSDGRPVWVAGLSEFYLVCPLP